MKTVKQLQDFFVTEDCVAGIIFVPYFQEVRIYGAFSPLDDLAGSNIVLIFICNSAAILVSNLTNVCIRSRCFCSHYD